jgi:hypothetical protein
VQEPPKAKQVVSSQPNPPRAHTSHNSNSTHLHINKALRRHSAHTPVSTAAAAPGGTVSVTVYSVHFNKVQSFRSPALRFSFY